MPHAPQAPHWQLTAGQAAAVQAWLWEESAGTQAVPPLLATVLIVLVLIWVPVPQVTLQVPQAPHPFHSQLMAAQACVLQGSETVFPPVQSVPPLEAGVVMVLEAVRVPPPQRTVHPDQDPH